jgi:5-methylcytosine-specific restriction endonuclease McrA
MEKICKKHGLTEYVIRIDGRSRCKKCAVDAVQKRRHVLKEKAVAYKGGKCVKCGYNKYVGALEFHHTNGDKEFGIGAKGYTRSWEKVKEELDKCILVCSNCHKEIEGNII